MTNQLLEKCSFCNQIIRFNEKTIRDKNIWYHANCFKLALVGKKTTKPKKSGILNATIIYDTTEEKTTSKNNLKPKILLARCSKCQNEIQLDEKTFRDKKNWYHAQCFRPIPEEKIIEKPHKYDEQESPTNLSQEQIKQIKFNPAQVTLGASILVFLAATSTFFLGVLSVATTIFGGSLILYILFVAKNPTYMKIAYDKRESSVFKTFLLLTPFALGTIVAYDGYSIWESQTRSMLLWTLTVTFWLNTAFIPLVANSIKVRSSINWITTCQSIEYISGIPKVSTSDKYTESPSTIKDFVRQRDKWYRENLQAHTLPYILLVTLIIPIIGFVAIGYAVMAIMMDDVLFVAQAFFIFLVAHYLIVILALKIDSADMRLVLHSGYLVLGFKQLVDFLLLKAFIDYVLRRKTNEKGR